MVASIRTNASSRLSPSVDQHNPPLQNQTGLLNDEIEKLIACLQRDLEKQLTVQQEGDATAYSSVIDRTGGQLPFEFDSFSIGLRLESCGVYISCYEEFALVILHTETHTMSLSRFLLALQESNLEVLQLKSRAISDRFSLTSIHAKVNDLAIGFREEQLHEKLVHMVR